MIEIILTVLRIHHYILWTRDIRRYVYKSHRSHLWLAQKTLVTMEPIVMETIGHFILTYNYNIAGHQSFIAIATWVYDPTENQVFSILC